MRISGLKICLSGLFIFQTTILVAQDSTQKEIWPEVEVYYRFNERFRFYGLISGTKANSEYTDGSISANLDYFAIPWLRGKLDRELMDTTHGYYWWFRLGYSYSNTPPGDAKKVVNIIETETNNNFFLPENILLTFRNRLDWRFVNGEFQPIYRPRLKFLRDFKTEYLTFDLYLWSEYFFYLNDKPQDRLRLTIGTDIKILRTLDLEIYYLHQFPNSPSVAPLDAIGIQLDFYFSSKKYRGEK
jgi:hypothetical protein